jgi:hypothetical protein
MDALTATIIAVGGSLIVIVISQIQNCQTGGDRAVALDRLAAPMLVATTAEAIFLAGAMAVMADPALPPVLTLPVEATAVEGTVGEAATAVAISGRRCLPRPVSPLNYSPNLF